MRLWFIGIVTICHIETYCNNRTTEAIRVTFLHLTFDTVTHGRVPTCRRQSSLLTLFAVKAANRLTLVFSNG